MAERRHPVAERLPITLHAYRLASAALTPLAGTFLKRRLRRGKENPERLRERYGEGSVPRPAGPLVWIHAASVGELLAVIPLIERIHKQNFAVLCTSGTVTSAQLASGRLPAGVVHQFVPLDTPRFVRRFLEHWKPDLALFVESDIWPNLIIAAAQRDIPMLLVNGRLSERSFNLWRYLPGTIGALLSRFELCLAQSPAHAERYRDLGAPRITTTGNLKLDVPQPPADEHKLRALRQALGARPVIAATSTHPGEEEIVVATHQRLRKTTPQLLTMIAPRHPDRGDEIAAIAVAAGLTVALRSRGGLPNPRTDIYIVDTLGELGIVYRLAPIVFVGGSLASHGGQNPIEAVKLGAAVLHGQHVWNFAEIYAALASSQGAQQVAGADDLAECIGAWLAHPDEARATTEAAHKVVARLAGALERTLGSLEPYLMQLRLERRARNA